MIEKDPHVMVVSIYFTSQMSQWDLGVTKILKKHPISETWDPSSPWLNWIWNPSYFPLYYWFNRDSYFMVYYNPDIKLGMSLCTLKTTSSFSQSHLQKNSHRLVGVIVAGERLPLCDAGDCVTWWVEINGEIDETHVVFLFFLLSFFLMLLLLLLLLLE